MKKIMLSILAIALTVSAVSGTAYALFSSTVQVQGVTMTSGNANLQVKVGETFTSDRITMPASFSLSNLYPGLNTTGKEKLLGHFSLKNNSGSPIPLAVTAKLTYPSDLTAFTSWNTLKGVVFLRVTGSNDIDTNWQSLNTLYTNGISLGKIAFGSTADYTIAVYVDDKASNEIGNKTLSGLSIDLVGTQTN